MVSECFESLFWILCGPVLFSVLAFVASCCLAASGVISTKFVSFKRAFDRCLRISLVTTACFAERYKVGASFRAADKKVRAQKTRIKRCPPVDRSLTRGGFKTSSPTRSVSFEVALLCSGHTQTCGLESKSHTTSAPRQTQVVSCSR